MLDTSQQVASQMTSSQQTDVSSQTSSLSWDEYTRITKLLVLYLRQKEDLFDSQQDTEGYKLLILNFWASKKRIFLSIDKLLTIRVAKKPGNWQLGKKMAFKKFWKK